MSTKESPASCCAQVPSATAFPVELTVHDSSIATTFAVSVSRREITTSSPCLTARTSGGATRPSGASAHAAASNADTAVKSRNNAAWRGLIAPGNLLLLPRPGLALVRIVRRIHLAHAAVVLRLVGDPRAL